MANHAQAVGILFAAFGQEQNKQRMKIYMQMLQDVPEDVFKKVVQKTICENKFLPSVAEIAEACRSLMATVSGTKEVPDWGEAWSEIEKAMRNTAWGRTPKFSHPAIEQAVNNYGWKSIHEVMADDFHTMQAQLRRMYDEAAKRYVENKRNEAILSSDALLQGESLKMLDVK